MRLCTLTNIYGTVDTFECYTYDDFPWQLLSGTAIKCNRHKGKEYIIENAAFDIETTTIHGENRYAFMYHWQMCINGIPLYGRTWKEWEESIEKLHEVYHLNENRVFVIYVHNLGFEYHFMRKFLERSQGELDVFAVAPRKPLKVATKTGFEFRCSWKLTNMSLYKASLNESGVKHLKAIGDLVYDVIRTPDTHMNDRQFGYCIGDVVSLWEIVNNKLKNEHDNLETIPLTSTGYVRRKCRRSADKTKGYRDFFLKQRMTENVYRMLKEAGRGGDTHANRHMSGRIWKDVYAYDVQSSYPAMLCMKQFPITAFEPYGQVESKEEFKKLLKNYACLFRITLTNVRLKEEIAMPYISESKCTMLTKSIPDNGRVLSAEIVQMTLTDIDWRIIQKQYDFDEEYYVQDIHIAEYGYMPDCILDVIRELFTNKTHLKGEIAKLKEKKNKSKQEKEDLENLKYMYSKTKNLLNGIFGMMYTDPVRNIITIEGDEWKEETPDISKALEKFYKSRNSFLVYAWGIWTTAHAREHLSRLIECTGQTNTIYCDTDSSYAVSPDTEAIELENRRIEAAAVERNAYCDYEGKRYFMGVYEFDGIHTEFKTLGAKKYVFKDGDDLTVTISGVSKEEGKKELKCIENFAPGFIFNKAAGMELLYRNDEIHEITIHGCTFETADSIPVEDSSYIIGVSDAYAELIGMSGDDIIKLKEKKNEHSKQRKKRREEGEKGNRS